EKAFGPDRKLHMLAIAGDRSTPSSINRNQGMHRAVAEDPTVILEQRGLIGLSTKTLRSVAPSSTWAASYLHPSSAAFITTIAESSFQYTQAAPSPALLRLLVACDNPRKRATNPSSDASMAAISASRGPASE